MKPYHCGQCGYLSAKISDLHYHLANHDESIGYFFHFDSRTAFPKEQCYDSQTQTLSEEETVSNILQYVEPVEIKTEINDVDEFMEEKLLKEEREFQAENEVSCQTDYVHNEEDLGQIKQDPSETNLAETEISDLDHSYIVQDSLPLLKSLPSEQLRDRGRFTSKKKLQRKKALIQKRNSNSRSKTSKKSNTKDLSDVKVDSASESLEKSPSTSQTGTKNKTQYTVFDRKKISVINKVYDINKRENGEEEYQCTKCTHSCTSEYEIQLHIYSSHKNESSAVCESCGKTFDDKSKLWSHRLHCNRRHICHICGKKWSGPSKLKEHLRLHSGEKPFICEHCGSSFRIKQGLINHLKCMHSEEKTYQCKLCDKSFSLTTGLLKHMKVHNKLTPFPCEFCDKRFSCRWNLKCHMRQHNGEKPYACTKCGEKFAHNVSRKTHEAKCSS